MKEHARHRRQHTVRMAADAVQLTIVFTIVPVIPFTILEIHLAYGAWGSMVMAMIFYVGYPLSFGALMWRTCSGKERKT